MPNFKRPIPVSRWKEIKEKEVPVPNLPVPEDTTQMQQPMGGTIPKQQPQSQGVPASQDNPGEQGKQPVAGWEKMPLTNDLKVNLQQIRAILKDCSDVLYRVFSVTHHEEVSVAVIYLDGLVDKSLVNDNIIKAIMLEYPMAAHGETQLTRANALSIIRNQAISNTEVKEQKLFGEIIETILNGDVTLLVDGHEKALMAGARGWEARAVSEPETETVIRGPREGFVETLRTNTSLLRRRIKNPEFKIETLKLGRITNTEVAIAYIKGIANDKIVKEVKNRLSRIDIDSVLETGYLEEFIEDSPASPFSQVNRTERPDKVAANLLEGRVAILVDGTPFVLTVPTFFVEFLQASEDYYERPYLVSFIRLMRFASLLMALLLPSLYIAITTYHPEMLPTSLLLSIAAQREGVPFPAFVEALLMEISFEALREAGVRLPRPVGQAVSIVGALIIGEAAVQAGFVAPSMVIVVAVTGIASFAIGGYTAGISMRLLRFPIMLLAASLGLYGVMLGIIAIVVHMVSLRSFGMPYLYPLAPTNFGDMKDTFTRVPWWSKMKRPGLISQYNRQRINPGQEPKPSEGGDNSAGTG
ncbi:MAG: spore germination protein [Clostridia bacterium]|nr:spore germination protein [Clostridia bacterium]